MKQYRKRFVSLALLGALTLGAAPFAVQTGAVRPAQAQGITVGIVDEDKLGEGYTAYKTAAAAINERAQMLDNQLAARNLLNETEGRRFDELILKDNQTAAEKAELVALVKSGTDGNTEYSALIGRAERSDRDKARMEELKTRAQNNQVATQRVSDALLSKIKKAQEDADTLYTDRANKVIQQVAESKKLALVMRKRAVVWNAPTIDITDEVLKQLNKV